MNSFAEDRELKEPVLVQQTAREGMKSLDELVKHGTPVPMSEFVKIMLWEKELLCEDFDRQIEKDKHDGWKVEEHTWCGEPYHAFAIPSLHIYQK